MDSESKWFWIAGACFFLAVGGAGAVAEYMKGKVEIARIEAGCTTQEEADGR